MASLRIDLPDGSQAIVPEWSLDSTATSMLAMLTTLTKENKEGLKALLEHAKSDSKDAEKRHKELVKEGDLLHKVTEGLGKEFAKNKPAPGAPAGPPTVTNGGGSPGKISAAADGAAASLDKFNKGAAIGETAFVKMYETASTAITGTIAAITIYGTMLVDSFMGLGGTLNELTKVGAGFTDSVGQGGMSAADAMADLSTMGIDAAATLGNFSGVVQTMSKKAFTELTGAFMDATNSGVELGMSLDDSVERMGAELQKRRAMGILDGMNQTRMTQQVTRTIKTQQKYAAVLGESVDNIVAFTDSLIQQTPVLTSSLLKFDKELRGKVISGITDFGSTMRAMGGEEGGAIAAAMTEAAASGAMGFSESMTGYIRTLPSLAGPMNDYIKQIKNGTLSQEDAEQMALDMTQQLGNLSDAEKQRVFLLDRAGDAQAASMAKAIIQFEASAKKIKDMGAGLTMDGVQTGTNTLSKIMKEITGIFEGLKLGFLGGLGNAVGDLGKLGGKTGKLTQAFEKAQETISKALMPVIGEIFGMKNLEGVTDLTKGAKSLGKSFGERLIPMIGTAAEYIADFVKRIPDMIQTAKDIGAGIMSFGKGFMSVMKVLGVFIGPVVFAFKVLASALDTVMAVLSPITSGFAWLGEKVSALANIFGDGESSGLRLSNMLGKLLGVVTLGVVGFKALSGILGLLGKSMPSMFANMGKSLMSGAKNMMGKLTGSISNATGGKLDGLFSKAKEKLTGKSKEMDMGSKAMDTASKKSKSFTKSLATGMKDISKGISDVLTNLSKGISNSVSNIATGIQKSISSLAKGIGDAGKGIGAGIGGLLKGTLTGLGQGLKVLGDPKALLGTVVLGALGGAMFIAGKAFQQFADINWAGVAAGAVALGVLGAAAFLLAPIAPVIGVGALAIGALGLALVPFAVAVKIAAPAMVELMGSFKLLNDVDPKNVLLLGPGLVSLAAGMAAFSAGGLISGVLDGLGSLFGSESPFDKLAKIGAAAPAIVSMTDNMSNMGQTVENFNTAMEQLDGKAAGQQFAHLAEGIDTLNESMDNINMMDLMKMAAMKTFGPIQQEQPETTTDATTPSKQGGFTGASFSAEYGDDLMVSPDTPSVEEAQKALDAAVAAQAKGINDFADITDQTALDGEVALAQMDLDNAKRAEVDKGAATKTRAEMTPFERAKARGQSRRDTAKRGGMASTVSPEDAARARAQAPSVAKAMNPVGETVQTQQPELKTAEAETDTGGKATELPGTSNKELFEQMVKNQEQTNKLLRSGNKLTGNLSDSF